MRKLLLYPRAVLDIEHTVRWYEAQREGLGREFESTLEAALERIRRTPEAFPLEFGDFRRVLLRRFPYQVFFRFDVSTVFVMLVFHTSQNPTTLRRVLRKS